MEEQQVWAQLQQLIDNSGNAPDIALFQWERLMQMADSPPLPTQLIIKTACEGSIYLREFAPLNFPAITPKLPLSANQQLALEMALSNSAISVIVGAPATGKTRIATSLADAAISHQKRVLILTHHSAALQAYAHLPGYPFRLSQQTAIPPPPPLKRGEPAEKSQQQDYRNWIISQLRSQHLAQPQMDYLPLHLLPDTELAKLRTPARLEKWLPIIQADSQQQLTEKLQPEFPHLSRERVQLLAYRLKELESLLQQQLRLSQVYSNLSEQAIGELASQLAENPQVPILGSVAELMQPQHQALWQITFDLVIVEEAQHLTGLELMLLSGLGQKLVLIGDEVVNTSFLSFNWLAQHLLPTYTCHLTEQFRLHPEIATSIYRVISERWMQTHTQKIPYQLPQLSHRLIWEDIPNETAGEQIVKFFHYLAPQPSAQIKTFSTSLSLSLSLSLFGIITFTESERDWLQSQLSGEGGDIKIATIAEWAGQEIAIALIDCTGNPTPDDINIALTRGQDYLILFGDSESQQQSHTLLRDLLFQPELHKERTVVFS